MGETERLSSVPLTGPGAVLGAGLGAGFGAGFGAVLGATWGECSGVRSGVRMGVSEGLVLLLERCSSPLSWWAMWGEW